MDAFYFAGPSILAFIAGVAIAVYAAKRSLVMSLIILAWVVAAIAIGQIPLFSGLASWQRTDLIGFTVFGALAFAPAALLVFASMRHAAFRRFLAQTPLPVLILTQSYRIGGIFLLSAYGQGLLPPSIGLVSGALDIFIAVTAILLAYYLRNDQYRSPNLTIAWAGLALFDFAWATMMVTLSFFGLVALSPAPMQMGNPPLLVISLFALPFGIFVSIYVILRLKCFPKNKR